MTELTCSTAFSSSKKELIFSGIRHHLVPAKETLFRLMEEKLTQEIADNLKDEGNAYQIILTIKPIEVE